MDWCASMLAWSHLAGRWPSQLLIELFASPHTRTCTQNTTQGSDHGFCFILFTVHFGKFDTVMLHIFFPAKNENIIIETLIVPSYASWLNTPCVKILWFSLAQKSYNRKFSSFLHQFLPWFFLIYEAKLLSKAEVESFTTFYWSIWSKN